MTDPPVHRRLAAILAADVAGYSRMMQADEAGTLAALTAHWRKVVEPAVRAHRGRVVQVRGDGMLVEFASAVDAVEAALAVQAAGAAAGQGVPPDRRIVLRIGVNLGDVIVQGADIFGDGVNIAARLEAAAEPGGILVSDSVHAQVRRKVDAGFEAAGALALKNIAEPVVAWHVRSGGALPEAGPVPQEVRPVVAVMRFAVPGGDAGAVLLADGIAEDILTELSRFAELRVVPRSAAFRLGPGEVEPARIARELGAGFAVQGSLRQQGQRLRITVQVVETAEGRTLWSERYDRVGDDLFAVQDEVVRVIVGTLAGRLRSAETARARRRPPASLAAYELVLRADALPTGLAEHEAEARELLEKAIALDPGYGLAYGFLAINHWREWQRDDSGSDALLMKAEQLARKGVALEPDNDTCHMLLSVILQARHDLELAEFHVRRGLALNPSRPINTINLGHLLLARGEGAAAVAAYDAARAMDPFFQPTWYWRTYGKALFIAGRHAEALAAFHRTPLMSDWLMAWIASAHSHLGESEAARAAVAEALRMNPALTIARVMEKESLVSADVRAHVAGGMRAAGLPD